MVRLGAQSCSTAGRPDCGVAGPVEGCVAETRNGPSAFLSELVGGICAFLSSRGREFMLVDEISSEVAAGLVPEATSCTSLFVELTAKLFTSAALASVLHEVLLMF